MDEDLKKGWLDEETGEKNPLAHNFLLLIYLMFKLLLPLSSLLESMAYIMKNPLVVCDSGIAW